MSGEREARPRSQNDYLRERAERAEAKAEQNRLDGEEAWFKMRDQRDKAEARVRELEEREEHLLHGICDALDDGHPTKPILRALLKGTDHEGHEKEPLNGEKRWEDEGGQ